MWEILVESSLPHYLANFLNGSSYTRKFFSGNWSQESYTFSLFFRQVYVHEMLELSRLHPCLEQSSVQW